MIAGCLERCPKIMGRGLVKFGSNRRLNSAIAEKKIIVLSHGNYYISTERQCPILYSVPRQGQIWLGELLT
jgi:hypothetical protein